MNLPRFDGVSIADFMYKDFEGVLTGLLFGEVCCDTWRDVWPTYFLEVKSTSEAPNEAFHISASQLETVRAPSILARAQWPSVEARHEKLAVQRAPSEQSYDEACVTECG